MIDKLPTRQLRNPASVLCLVVAALFSDKEVKAQDAAPATCERLADLAGRAHHERCARGSRGIQGRRRTGRANGSDRLQRAAGILATISPTPSSVIKIEVWLPAQGWNGKFAGVGNGGFSGAIPHFAMIDPLRRRYAVAATDTGHEGGLLTRAFRLTNPRS